QDSRDALPAQAWHELRGIAEGAGISLEAALLLNLWEPPSDAAAASESLAFAFAEHPSGRAALGVRGQTLCSDPLVFKAVSTAEGGSYGLLGRPGDLGGWIGLNKAGVALASLPAASADQRLGGLPSTTLLGLALQASTTAEGAARWLAQARRSGGGGALLVEGSSGQAALLEWTAHRHTLHSASGSVWSWSGTLQDPWLRELGGNAPPSGAAGSWLQANAGWLSREKALAWLAEEAREDGCPAALLLPDAAQWWFSCPGCGDAAALVHLNLDEVLSRGR
ncbi:MAG: hypothetical protein GX605_13305, partial [Chloroflexi bacterium]|nr:hypothetical protein [Chloroflexota bacterium]